MVYIINYRYLGINDPPGGCCAEAPAEGNLVVCSRAKAPAECNLVRIVRVRLQVSVCLGKKNVAQQNSLWEKSRSVGMEGRQNKAYYFDNN